MGVFDFLKKKKEPEFPSFTEPKIPGESMEHPGIGLPPDRPDTFDRPMQMPPMDMGQDRMGQSHEQPMISKDLEIISAKLDSMKATLEAINQRLNNLERIAAGEKREKYF